MLKKQPSDHFTGVLGLKYLLEPINIASVLSKLIFSPEHTLDTVALGLGTNMFYLDIIAFDLGTNM